MSRIPPAVLGVPVVVTVGCLAHPNFQGEGRLTDYTAYALHPGEFQAGAGLVGTGMDDLGASARFEAGIVRGLQAGTNVAHDVFGIVNLNAKYAFVEVGDFAFAAGMGFKWFNPRLLWVLPEQTREKYSGVNIYILPVTATASWAALSWMGVHLRLGYTWSGVDATLDSGDALARAGFGGHEVFAQPALTFYPTHGLAVIAGAQVPLVSVVRVAGQAEEPVAPGVVVGAGAVEYQRLDVKGLNTLYLAVQFCWGKTNLRLSLTRGLRFLEQQAGWLPAVEAYWRF